MTVAVFFAPALLGVLVFFSARSGSRWTSPRGRLRWLPSGADEGDATSPWSSSLARHFQRLAPFFCSAPSLAWAASLWALAVVPTDRLRAMVPSRGCTLPWRRTWCRPSEAPRGQKVALVLLAGRPFGLLPVACASTVRGNSLRVTSPRLVACRLMHAVRDPTRLSEVLQAGGEATTPGGSTVPSRAPRGGRASRCDGTCRPS